MRYICCYRLLEDGELKMKVEMLEVKTDNVVRGEIDLLKSLSEKYNFSRYYVEREEQIPGVLYIRPKKVNKIDDLCELDMSEWERQEYERINIFGR